MSETAVLNPSCVRHEIVPVCCHCRRVRTPSGDWIGMAELPTGRLSHGICRDCFLNHYPEFPLPDEVQ
jgi:hypothetical protein